MVSSGTHIKHYLKSVKHLVFILMYAPYLEVDEVGDFRLPKRVLMMIAY